MSRDYVVVLVEPDANGSIDGKPAEVFMRFTEQPASDFLGRIATGNPGKRVYCLMGASTWHEH